MNHFSVHLLLLATTWWTAIIADVSTSPPPGVIAGTPGKDVPSPPAPERSLVLAVLPDRTTGRDWGLKYLTMAVDDLNRVKPDAVLSIGDMIQGYTRSVEQWDREVMAYRAIIDGLTMPFYPLAGNHEVVSGTRDRQDLTFHERYQQVFAPLYYAVEFDLASAVVLYSDDPTFVGGFGLGADQVRWLNECLERLAARGKPILVLLHRPLWRSRGSGWAEQVHPLLVRHGVRAVIGGHFHSLQRDPDWDGVQYHIVGTCGGMIDQLPLAGQLQHLTFVRVAAGGELSIYHQAVGATLPDDFVLQADQDRVNRLKTDDRVIRFANAVDDPFHGPVRSVVRLELSNPIDVPIEITARLVRARPDTESWPASTWLSRMEEDRFNPFTTDTETTFRMTGEPLNLRLGPGEHATAELELASPQIDRPRNPPEFEFRAHFKDGHGRTVPTIIRQRLPLKRDVKAGSRGVQWPLCAWQFSVYETLEANPSLSVTRDADGLILTIRTPDNCLWTASEDARPTLEKALDPTNDAVVLVTMSGAKERRFYLEPRAEIQVVEIDGEGSRPSSIRAEWVPWDGEGPGWAVRIRLSTDVVNAEPETGTVRMNVGVADNDATFHTQWRWLAPASAPATVR